MTKFITTVSAERGGVCYRGFLDSVFGFRVSSFRFLRILRFLAHTPFSWIRFLRFDFDSFSSLLSVSFRLVSSRFLSVSVSLCFVSGWFVSLRFSPTRLLLFVFFVSVISLPISPTHLFYSFLFCSVSPVRSLLFGLSYSVSPIRVSSISVFPSISPSLSSSPVAFVTPSLKNNAIAQKIPLTRSNHHSPIRYSSIGRSDIRQSNIRRLGRSGTHRSARWAIGWLGDWARVSTARDLERMLFLRFS